MATIRATCSAHLILPDVIALLMIKPNYGPSHYAIFPVLLLLLPP